MHVTRSRLFGSQLLMLILLLVACSIRVTLAEEHGSSWRYKLAPHVWLPTIDGELRYGVPSGELASPDVDVGPSSWLEALDFALLLTGEARRDRLSLFGDFIVLSFSADDSNVESVETTLGGPRSRIPVGASANTGTEVDLDGIALTAGLGYSLARSAHGRLDAFGGIRYFRVNTSLDWRISADITTPGAGRALSASGTLDEDVDLLDGIAGLRGELRLGEGRWSLPYYLDVGTGSSDLTWQAAGGVAYGFERWDVMVLYRHLYYDQGDDKLLQQFSFSGPAIAARFRF